MYIHSISSCFRKICFRNQRKFGGKCLCLNFYWEHLFTLLAIELLLWLTRYLSLLVLPSMENIHLSCKSWWSIWWLCVAICSPEKATAPSCVCSLLLASCEIGSKPSSRECSGDAVAPNQDMQLTVLHSFQSNMPFPQWFSLVYHNIHHYSPGSQDLLWPRAAQLCSAQELVLLWTLGWPCSRAAPSQKKTAWGLHSISINCQRPKICCRAGVDC